MSTVEHFYALICASLSILYKSRDPHFQIPLHTDSNTHVPGMTGKPNIRAKPLAP